MKYDIAVYVLRAQPLHLGHIEVINSALKIADKVILILGSAHAPQSLRNPFSFQIRKELIEGCFDITTRDRLNIVGVDDSAYNFESWLLDVKKKVNTLKSDKVVLVGSYKDDTSYYLSYFPEWESIARPIKDGSIDATTIRNAFYEGTPQKVRHMLHKNVYDHMLAYFRREDADFGILFEEYDFVKKYKKAWSNTPFPSVFVTTDAIVFCMGYVLLVERKFNPGKGKYALPGGFIKQEENLLDSCIRELHEETRLGCDVRQLKGSVKEVKVFDHPRRDPRGRIITHGHFFRIDINKLPVIRGGDDASKAFWFPLQNLQENEGNFYSDHCQIIKYFIARGN